MHFGPSTDTRDCILLLLLLFLSSWSSQLLVGGGREVIRPERSVWTHAWLHMKGLNPFKRVASRIKRMREVWTRFRTLGEEEYKLLRTKREALQKRYEKVCICMCVCVSFCLGRSFIRPPPPPFDVVKRVGSDDCHVLIPWELALLFFFGGVVASDFCRSKENERGACCRHDQGDAYL